MRSDEWILVEDAFTETASVSSVPESIVDIASLAIRVAEVQPTDLLLSDQSEVAHGEIRACGDNFKGTQEESCALTEFRILGDVCDSDDRPTPTAFVRADLRGSIRVFSTLSIISPRIDPVLGRLAAPKLRARGLVGCIYKPDVEDLRACRRFRERASLLLKAN